MANLTGRERATYVQNMFSRIAGRYDVMNRLMTFGQDLSWRREVIRHAAITPGSRVLDLGAGTGDIALEIHARQPEAWPIAGDFTVEMMRVGKKRPNGDALDWCATDALHLPYADGTFDAVVSGYLMRNVSDVHRALSEQWRVLKPGGRIVILDTTRPPENILAPFIRLHLNYVIPALGKLITGESEAYTYLPDSTKGFLRAEELAVRMTEAEFGSVGFKRVMFGTMGIHWGRK
ncbi:MAG: ubiquinone/menaquinone biosynthesis methyltransferase [Anaerolineales bacterium]|nr:ubiquinone/menaquinone biosynthesis methyltransferase [Anaerolineales bacterium]